MGALLGPEFFNRDTVRVARDILGKVLVREANGILTWGRLVEVEAYLGPDDLAAHSRVVIARRGLRSCSGHLATRTSTSRTASTTA